MTCEFVSVPGGGTAIVCSSGRRQRCRCGRPATLLCDWKVPARRSGTCDAPLCADCAVSPVPAKDLCAKHSEAFEAWKAERARRPKPNIGAAS